MPVMTFDTWPRRVHCKDGAVKDVPELIKDMGRKHALIFTDPFMSTIPLVKDLEADLEKNGIEVHIFSKIQANPVVAAVEEAAEYMREIKPDVLVCLGGGSPIDAGKVANVVYTHGGKAKDYDIAIGGIMKIKPILLPLIAIPTTAGTGTEVTMVGVLTDVERKTKFGVLSPLLIPDVAVLDPQATVSMPPGLTANTGIDALTHCIECYTSNCDFPPAQGLAIEGVRMISQNLRRAVADGKDVEARQAMLMASMMAGTAFSLGGLGVCHAMAHQLSAFFDMPHGMANAILLPHVIEYNLKVAEDKFADIAAAMGGDISGMSRSEAAKLALDLVKKLAEDVGAPKYLDDGGATKDKIPGMVERAMLDNPITQNPQKPTEEDVTNIYLAAFK
jgi:alcohol dehydrogenase class IV